MMLEKIGALVEQGASDHKNPFDREIVAQLAPCSTCGHELVYKGLRYGHTYHAFAFCPKGHEEMEF